MAVDRTAQRAAAPAERRHGAAAAVRRPAAAAESPAQALQRRFGNHGTQALVARSIAAGAAREISGGGPAPVSVSAPTSVQLSRTTRLPAKVSKPTDPAELEAEDTARKVVRMREPSPPASASPNKKSASDAVHRAAAPAGAAPATAPAARVVSISGGSPLPAAVRGPMERRFGANFANVRVHTGEAAAEQSATLGANAFTVGEHIFFGRDKFQPQSASGQELIAHELAHTIQQGAAVQRETIHRSAVTVSEQVAPHVQRSIFDIANPRTYFARAARAIPGFTMLTVVIGFNPITNERVERNAGNILRGAIELIPGGALITEALNNHGVFDKVSLWAAQQFETLKDIGSSVYQDIENFIAQFKLTDLASPGELWDKAKGIVERPIARVLAFAKALKDGIVNLIKDAILKPIAAFARTTRGYPLLCAVMGKDPITGEPVPQDAESLLGAFMKFIGEEQVWNTMQQAKAIPRAFAWFKGAMAAILGFVHEIPGLFVQAFRSLEIVDIILIPRAFMKLAGVFGNFAVRFVTWGATAVWNLLEIIFDVVSPGALAYIKKTGAALKSILRNPLPFVGNLVKAAKLGFLNFGAHFLDHLKAGLINWLTGALPGIYIPKAFSLVEIAKFVFSVLGLTWANIRQKLVKATSETVVKALETGFDIVVTLVRDGPAAAWDKIKEQLANLKDMVIGGITDFVVDMVVKKAIPKLIAMFIPGAGFISAILSIYDTVMVFVNKIKQIVAVVTGFIDSIVAIAAGQIGAAAARVETALAGVLSLAINFLAGFAGLGKVADKVMAVINKIRAPIDKALDWLVGWIVKTAKALGKKLFGKDDKDKDKDKRDFRVRAKEELGSKFAGKLTRAKMQAIVADVFAKYQKEGLKGIVAKHPSGKGNQYEAVLIASTIPVSTAEADFDIDAADLDLGWGRTSATGVLVAGSKKYVFGPHQNDGKNHAEENLIAELNQNFGQVAAPKSSGVTNRVIFNITRSPCGDMPKAHNCARQIQQFAAKWNTTHLLEVEVRAASIYFGKFRKASREAIKKLADAGIKFTAWDLIEEMGDPSEVSKDTRDKLQKRIDSTKENLPEIIKVGAGG
jgi:hypothetical protein